MKTKFLLSFSAAAACFAVIGLSCSKDLGYNTNRTELDLSGDYQYDFSSTEMATLGRVLFYDKALSINNSVSCGSCHKQAYAFADNAAFSKGFENFTTDRNTPPIQNLGMGAIVLGGINGGFGGQALFWDGRERLLENMVMQPMFNHVEMGMRNTGDVVAKVESKSYYRDLFLKAFGDEEVTFERISLALSDFVRNIQANTSRFDLTSMNSVVDMSSIFTPAEIRGLDLFFGKYDCGSCHQLNVPSGYFPQEENGELVNIGLDAVYTDKGLGALTKKEEDNGRFKIPNLRNVAITAPYMHDGRFDKLEDVIDHYSVGIQNNPNLDHRLKDANGQPLVLNISQQDKADLIAFLHTLTDAGMITDPKYSDPFKRK